MHPKSEIWTTDYAASHRFLSGVEGRTVHMDAKEEVQATGLVGEFWAGTATSARDFWMPVRRFARSESRGASRIALP
jgi:hypothetical protein